MMTMLLTSIISYSAMTKTKYKQANIISSSAKTRIYINEYYKFFSYDKI